MKQNGLYIFLLKQKKEKNYLNHYFLLRIIFIKNHFDRNQGRYNFIFWKWGKISNLNLVCLNLKDILVLVTYKNFEKKCWIKLY